MEYCETLPSKHLAPFVKCFWSLKQPTWSTAFAPEPVLPDGCIELIFNLADPFRRYHADGSRELQPRVLVAGQMRSGAVIEPTGRVELFGIRFHHAGAFPFFRFPLNELTDQIIDLNLVWGASDRDLAEQIAEATTAATRVAAAESALLKRLPKPDDADRSVAAASSLIVNSCGVIPIEQIAGQINLSARRLERRFLARVGITPKSFSRIIRFQQFVNTARQSAATDLLDLALSVGYYDQSHLIHECRKFTGKAPVEFLAREHKLTEAFLPDRN